MCERSTLSSITKGVVFAGYMLGVIIGGVLSDKFGRKPLSYFPAVVASTLALVASFVNEYWIYALLRGTVGMFVGRLMYYVVSIYIWCSMMYYNIR